MTDVGIVVIGRNEGERLNRCLRSVSTPGRPVVYVDSGSSDGSVKTARSLDVDVVELDASLAFSAARARNAGAERLAAIAPHLKFVQFIDGDCEIREGWIERARAELDARPDAAVVCGRRRERNPDASIYNRLADLEWETPTGEVKSCGGDALMRLDAFRDSGGFDPSVVAGEEPELCQRLRNRGWKILRIDADMTWHDAAITRFDQWWNRQVRSGYGATDVATRFRQGREPLFVRQVRSAELWSIGWLSVVVLSIAVAGIISVWFSSNRLAFWSATAGAAVLLAAWPAQVLKLAIRNFRRTRSVKIAIEYGLLTMIAKWGFLLGRRRYLRDRRSGRFTRQIEYKSPAAAPA